MCHHFFPLFSWSVINSITGHFFFFFSFLSWTLVSKKECTVLNEELKGKGKILANKQGSGKPEVCRNSTYSQSFRYLKRDWKKKKKKKQNTLPEKILWAGIAIMLEKPQELLLVLVLVLPIFPTHNKKNPSKTKEWQTLHKIWLRYLTFSLQIFIFSERTVFPILD